MSFGTHAHTTPNPYNSPSVHNIRMRIGAPRRLPTVYDCLFYTFRLSFFFIFFFFNVISGEAGRSFFIVFRNGAFFSFRRIVVYTVLDRTGVVPAHYGRYYLLSSYRPRDLHRLRIIPFCLFGPFDWLRRRHLHTKQKDATAGSLSCASRIYCSRARVSIAWGSCIFISNCFLSAAAFHYLDNGGARVLTAKCSGRRLVSDGVVSGGLGAKS